MKAHRVSIGSWPTALDGPLDYGSLVADSADLHTVVCGDGVYRYVSPGCQRLFGWDPAALEGGREVDFVHPDDLTALHAARAALYDADLVSATYRFLCRDGSSRWTETTSRRVAAAGSELVVSAVRDITERLELTARLERQALTDPLTGVANRTAMMDHLGQALRRLGPGGGLLGVLYMDLDRFKVVNDSFGHHVGDAVLLQMAERLLHHIRPADTLGRVGGDEFVIVAEGLADEQAAIDFAQRVIDAGREPYRIGDAYFVCTVSAGVACTNDPHRTAHDALREADLALYRAKDRGRDRAEVFDERLRTKAVDGLAIERNLRDALTDGGLVVEYQPIIDLRAGRAVGAEALLRIASPGCQLLQPHSFLDVAEKTGMLIRMDEWVLTEATKQISAWHSKLAGTEFTDVAINITGRHLADVGFQRMVIDNLDGRRVAHHHLQIEVAERVLLEASNSAMSGLQALRDSGVQLGLDNFGTGYSSLAFLRQFPLDYVKIDRSLISALEEDEREQAIVAAIISLSHALHLTVVAQGVETEAQLQILQHLDCDRAQGFLYAVPGPPDLIDDFVNAGPTSPESRREAVRGQPHDPLRGGPG